MPPYDPVVLAFAGAVAVLLLLTFIEGNVIVLLRARPWERNDRNGDVPPAADWLRSHVPEFVVAALTARSAATAVLAGSTAVLVGRMTGPAIAPPTAPAAALPVLFAFAVQAAGYLLLSATAASPPAVVLQAARLFTLALWPVAGLGIQLGRRLSRRVTVPGSPAGDDEERARDLEEWAEEVARTGALDEPEREMVRGVLELGDTVAREVMAPRLDMVAVSVDTPFDEVVRTAIASGYSRIPLYEGTLDHVIGIVYTKDLLTVQYQGGNTDNLRSLAREPYFIPETKKIRDLLQQFRQSRVHMAIVIDEYGGTAGLVTIEDLLEEIVGEIEDEFDHQPREEQVVRLSDDVALVDARLSIDDFNDLFHLDLDAADYDTVGGFVYTHLGKIPTVGDRVPVNGVVVLVEATLGRRIKRLRVVRTPPSPSPPTPANGASHAP